MSQRLTADQLAHAFTVYPSMSGSIAEAADAGARLLLLEGVVPADDLPHLSKMIDLTMLGVTTGQERSADEYRTLLDRAGFTLDRIVDTPTPYSIVEATLR